MFFFFDFDQSTQYDIEKLVYSNFFWSLGTTSFRTKSFNFSIERQLELLKAFWAIPENHSQGWEKKYMAPCQIDIYQIKNKYYDFLRDNGFTVGDDQVKYKAAREKTSGLVDIGLINENRRLTEVGEAILAISKSGDYSSDNFLNISKDSMIYLKQLLKANCGSDRTPVRPFVVLLYLVIKLGYLSYDEFTYLAPLCTTQELTDEMVQKIVDIRNNKLTIDQVIVQVFMSQENYQQALAAFLDNKVTRELICAIGINRKSREYDKPYYRLYQSLYDVFVNKNYNNVLELFKATIALKNPGVLWRQFIFDTTSKKALLNNPEQHVSSCKFYNIDPEDFKRTFFVVMHLIKNKKTLGDYLDLNRRYVNMANVFIMEDSRIILDVVPKQFFGKSIDILYQEAFKANDLLEVNCSLEEICPALCYNEEEIIAGINQELSLNLNTIAEAYSEVDKLRYQRFNDLIEHKFNDTQLLTLLDYFENRNDEEIYSMVTDNADVPTIFEYILGIIWYKTSEYKGKILDYLKLSLDANLLPITHAAGGEADIVYQYTQTQDYPEHSVLLEATLANDTNQRRLEMEPVSRHVGNHVIRTNNQNSYGVFATTYLDVNVISDFKGRKHIPFFDTQDYNKSVNGMKIIPIDTSDLKGIISQGLKYKDLYSRFDTAYCKSDEYPNPITWYKELIQLNK